MRPRRRRGLAVRLAGARATRGGARANDVAMMLRAMGLARHAAARGEVPVGAVVYRGRTVVAEQANDREATGDPTGHAELAAMREAGKARGAWRLSDCSLAVTLEPCAMCATAASFARLTRVVFAAGDPKGGGVLHGARIFEQPTCHWRCAIRSGVEAAPAADLLRTFFRARR